MPKFLDAPSWYANNGKLYHPVGVDDTGAYTTTLGMVNASQSAQTTALSLSQAADNFLFLSITVTLYSTSQSTYVIANSMFGVYMEGYGLNLNTATDLFIKNPYDVSAFWNSPTKITFYHDAVPGNTVWFSVIGYFNKTVIGV